MDQITKALRRLRAKERIVITGVLRLIAENSLAGLDVKKLQGRDDIFRVRKGKIRIIFRMKKNEEAMILSIERRSDTTYKE